MFLGKVYTLGGDDNAFAHDYHSTFMNTALDFNTTLGLAPFTAYGGGLVILPWDGAVFTVSVIDPSGTATNNDISDAFKDGVLVSAEGRVTIKPFGLVGHQLLGGLWSNKERISLEQDPSNIARRLLTNQFPRLVDPGPVLTRFLERFFPSLLVPTQPLNRVDYTWSVYYNFDQYLWSPEGVPDRGIGVFFRFGASDGVANPVKYAYNVGIGAKGLWSWRPCDNFGIGWARTELSDNFVPFLRQQLRLGLGNEDAIELYYNAEITRWLSATLDLQIIDQALDRTLDGSGVAAQGHEHGGGARAACLRALLIAAPGCRCRARSSAVDLREVSWPGGERTHTGNRAVRVGVVAQRGRDGDSGWCARSDAQRGIPIHQQW